MKVERHCDVKPSLPYICPIIDLTAAKYLTATEWNGLSSDFRDGLRRRDYRYLEKLSSKHLEQFGVEKITSFDDLLQKAPWARKPLHVLCNPQRFPRLFDLEDARTPHHGTS